MLIGSAIQQAQVKQKVKDWTKLVADDNRTGNVEDEPEEIYEMRLTFDSHA
jgi:hypothetical protein